MKNPWIKSNPFLSIWLSGANRMFATARGLAMAQAERNARAMMAEGNKQMMKFWRDAAKTPSPRKTRKARHP